MEAKELLEKLSSKSNTVEEIATAALALCASLDKSASKTLAQAANEVLHYSRQLAQADTDQWRQSFQYELQQSIGSMKKILKKLG